MGPPDHGVILIRDGDTRMAICQCGWRSGRRPTVGRAYRDYNDHRAQAETPEPIESTLLQDLDEIWEAVARDLASVSVQREEFASRRLTRNPEEQWFSPNRLAPEPQHRHRNRRQYLAFLGAR